MKLKNRPLSGCPDHQLRFATTTANVAFVGWVLFALITYPTYILEAIAIGLLAIGPGLLVLTAISGHEEEQQHNAVRPPHRTRR